MLGHEAVRAAVRDHLAASVPARLDAIRESLEADWPRDPVAYRLIDTLSMNESYPMVLVRSTDAPSMKADTAVAAGAPSVWIVTYNLEVGVAVASSVLGSWEQTCVARDRLLLAVREALLAPADLGMVTLARSTVTEETGPAVETINGQPLAVGSLKLTAMAVETLLPLPAPALIPSAELTTTPADPSQSL